MREVMEENKSRLFRNFELPDGHASYRDRKPQGNRKQMKAVLPRELLEMLLREAKWVKLV